MKKNSYLCVTNTTKLMRTQFIDFLASRGASNVDFRDDKVIFSLNGLNYIFVSNDSDRHYFRLILPNISPSITEENPRHEQIINEINRDYKVAKAFVVNDRIWISVEQFVYSNENINFLFERCISLLPRIIDQVRRILNSESND